MKLKLDWLLNSTAPQRADEIQLSTGGTRIITDDVVQLIIKFEGNHRRGSDGLIYPYHDVVGYPTIGIGHLLSRIPWEDLTKYQSITVDEAMEQKKKNLDKFSLGVSRLINVPLEDHEFGAIVSLSFNIGLGNLQGSTLRKKINRGDSREDCASEFLKWNKAGGKIIRGLTMRRAAESKLFLGYYGD